MTVDHQRLQRLDGDQRRETVDARQRFVLFREAAPFSPRGARPTRASTFDRKPVDGAEVLVMRR